MFWRHPFTMPTIIRSTPENAHQLKEVIAGRPELADTIKSLRQQDVFPGLRCMNVMLDDGPTVLAQASDHLRCAHGGTSRRSSPKSPLSLVAAPRMDQKEAGSVISHGGQCPGTSNTTFKTRKP